MWPLAFADLEPTLHHTRGRGAALAPIALIIAGIAMIQLVGMIESAPTPGSQAM